MAPSVGSAPASNDMTRIGTATARYARGSRAPTPKSCAESRRLTPNAATAPQTMPVTVDTANAPITVPRARADRDDLAGGSNVDDGDRRIEIRDRGPNDLHHLPGDSRRPHDDMHVGVGPLGARDVDSRFRLLVEPSLTDVRNDADDRLRSSDAPRDCHVLSDGIAFKRSRAGLRLRRLRVGLRCA
jgi:hypothetical protein